MEKTFYFKCLKCDATDHGAPLLDYEVVDCPSCGSRDLDRWEAKPNLSRAWSYCEARGHEWLPSNFHENTEVCYCCADMRSFVKQVITRD